jgi:predicted MFS family arabinose efflux permease
VIKEAGQSGSVLWRGMFASILATGMAAATFAQFLFGVLARFLIEEFDISRSQLGFLTTSAFVVGAFASPVAGRLVDRIGGRRVFAAAMVLVVAANLLMAGAQGFPVMLAGAGIAGFALGCCNPTTNKLIAAHLPPGARGVTMGFKQAGVQIGAFVIGFGIPPIASAFGWRIALATTTIIPLIALVTALVFVPHDRMELKDTDVRSRDHLNATVWWMAGYAVLMGAGVATFSTYLPLFAHEKLGFSDTAGGLLIGVMGAIGIASRIAWGWGSERRGDFAVPLIAMAIGSVAATLLTISSTTAGSWLLWISAVLFGATAVTWNVVGMLAIVAEVDARTAGLASGYVQTGFYMGFVISPAAFGYLVDRSGEYTLGWSLIAVVFGAASFLAWAWYGRRKNNSYATA